MAYAMAYVNPEPPKIACEAGRTAALVPSRSEAIRRLIEIALTAKSKGQSGRREK
jgi:hypothetical protein